MKKYLKLLPVMLYPYAYIPFVIGFIATGGISNDNGWFIIFAFLSTIAINLLTIFSTLYLPIQTARGKYDAKESAFHAMLIKLVHIPAFIFHFIIGCISIVMSVWGIPFMIWAILIDLLTIGVSGISSIGNTIKMYKDGYYSSKGAAIFFGICHFIYCIDVVIVIVNYFRVAKTKPKGKKERAEIKLNPPTK